MTGAPTARPPARSWGQVAIATLLMVAAVIAALLLGRWQYDGWLAQRAAEERDLSAVAPVPLGSLLGPDDPFPGAEVGRPVTVEGVWLGSQTVTVADRSLAGTPGRWVVTPVEVDETGSAALVVRGFLPAGETPPPPPDGAVTVVGALQPAEGTGALDPDRGDREVPELRTASVTELVDRDLYSGFVVQREPAPRPPLIGVPPEEVPAVGVSTALRNLLYAVQWLLFAGIAVFFWWRWWRDSVGSGP